MQAIRQARRKTPSSAAFFEPDGCLKQIQEPERIFWSKGRIAGGLFSFGWVVAEEDGELE